MATLRGYTFVIMFIIAITIMQFKFSFGKGSDNFITWKDFEIPNYAKGVSNNLHRSHIIIVSKDGTGNSTTVQDAIGMVPDGNSHRFVILVKPGIYKEKVTIPITKPYISLIGTEEGDTKITWNSRASDLDLNGKPIGTLNSATFAVEADYFCAKHIIFENSAPAATPGAVGEQAVALRLAGDKAMIHQCQMLGTQDTLCDQQGRHYFYRNLIQGSIDFIFGNARSLYEECTLRSVASSIGAVAAQQRMSSTENTGFSFYKCHLTGSGSVFLGRAWGPYSRIVYADTTIDGIVVSGGWSDWGIPSRQSTVFFGVYRCNGAGANLRSTVKWAKSLTHQEAIIFIRRHFIDGSLWLKLR